MLLVVGGGCQEVELPDPAPVVWTGDNIEFATRGDVAQCGGSLRFMDDFVGRVLGEMDLESEVLPRIYLVPDEVLDDLCDYERCSWAHNVYTNQGVDTHELVHALRSSTDADEVNLPGISFFEEGLAVLYQHDTHHVLHGQDVEEALSINPINEKIGVREYGIAGHFSRYLSDTVSTARLADFVGEQGGATTLADITHIYEEKFDESLEAASVRYQAEYPPCESFAVARHPVECAQDPIPFSEGRFELNFDLSCSDDDAIGPFHDRMWKTFTFDIEEEQELWIRSPQDDIGFVTCRDFKIELIDCNLGCTGPHGVSPNEEQGDSPDDWPNTGGLLGPGRYLLRLSRPVDNPGPVCIVAGPFE